MINFGSTRLPNPQGAKLKINNTLEFGRFVYRLQK